MCQTTVSTRFADKRTHRFASRHRIPTFAGFEDQAHRRLFVFRNALSLDSLRSVPRNCLEALKGDRAGQYSIRVNRQYRICFQWIDGEAVNIKIVDYHR